MNESNWMDQNLQAGGNTQPSDLKPSRGSGSEVEPVERWPLMFVPD